MACTRFLPCGDTALVRRVRRPHRPRRERAGAGPGRPRRAAHIAGIVEMVPTFRSLMIHYDPSMPQSRPDGEAVRPAIRGSKRRKAPAVCGAFRHATTRASRPDLAEVATRTGLTPQQVAERHTRRDVSCLHGGLPAGLSLHGRPAGGAGAAAPGRPAHQGAARLHRHRDHADGGLHARKSGRLASDRRNAGALCATRAGIRPPCSAPATRSCFEPISLGEYDECPARRAPPATTVGTERPTRGARMKPALQVVASRSDDHPAGPGRPAIQRLGVPVSGALDGVSLRAANPLVGNPPERRCWRSPVRGRRSWWRRSVRVALGRHRAHRDPCRRGRLAVARGSSCRAFACARARSAHRRAVRQRGLRYLAVEGGFDVARCLGSQSTYVRAGLGGFEGRPLRAGDILPLKQDERRGPRRTHAASRSTWRRHQLIRVVLGPQDDYLHRARQTHLPGERLHRLAGTPTAWACGSRAPRSSTAKGYNIVSDGIAAGSIQVPGQRPADRAAGRPADDRRLPQDRHRDLRRHAGAGPPHAGRQGGLRGGERDEAEAAHRQFAARIAALRRQIVSAP